MKILTLLILGTLLSFHVASQKGSLQGMVTVDNTNTHLPDANVWIVPGSPKTFSSGDGRFSIDNILPGEYMISANLLGYEPYDTIIRIKANKVTTLNIYLRETLFDLPEAVISSISMTGGVQRIKSIPGSAHYIPSKMLDQFQYTDVNRVLGNIPGIHLQQEDGFGLRPNIGLRGSGVERSSKVTIMEDGILAAPAPYAAPAAYYFPTMGRMSGVEVLKGSSQIKYGPFTTGGAINFLSTPIPSSFSGRLKLNGGNHGLVNVHGHAGNTHKHISYLLEGLHLQSSGFKSVDNGETGFEKTDYLAKIRLHSKPNAKIYQILQFKASRSSENSNETYLGLTDKDYETDPYLRYPGSQKDLMKTNHRQYVASYTIKPLKLLDLTFTGYRTEFKRNWYKLDKVKGISGSYKSISKIMDKPENYISETNILKGLTSPGADALSVKANNRSYFAQGLQLQSHITVNVENALHQIELGLRFHEDQMDRFQWLDKYAMVENKMQLTESGVPGTESNRVKNAHAKAAFLNYQLEVGDFTFYPGLRYENIQIKETDYGNTDPGRTGIDANERENTMDVLIPGVGIEWNPFSGFHLFGGVHKGFAPSGSNPSTNPEKSINYELGARFQHNSFSGEAVLFYNNYQNLLGADLASSGGQGTQDLFNGGAAETHGLELLLNYHLWAAAASKWNVPVSLMYSFTDGKFRNAFDSEFEGWGTVNNDDKLPYLAHHRASISISATHPNISFHLSGTYTDKMRTMPGQGSIPRTESTDAAFVLDASIHFKVLKWLSIFTSFQNLTDNTYIVARRPAGIRPGLPRTVTAGVSAHF